MEFNAVNGWLALALCRLGARIKWASNNRAFGHAKGESQDDISIAQAVAIKSDGMCEPYVIKKNEPSELPITSYWTSVIRSLIWNKKDGNVEFADFIVDPDGIAQMVINIAVTMEWEQYKPSIIPSF